MYKLISLCIGYAIGCISAAYILGRIVKRDFRKEGSGNLGTTNVLRILGPKAGAMIFVIDILKGVVPFWIAYFLFADIEKSLMAGVYASAGAIIGHIFPFYLKFKGGKGIATSIGMMLCVAGCHAPWVIPIVAIITFGTALISKYVSLGSVLFMVLIPIVLIIIKFETEGIILLSSISLLITWKHRENIVRLIHGNERKLSFKKQENS